MLKPDDICDHSCFINKDNFFYEFDKVKNHKINKISIPLDVDNNYIINYSPVGNYPEKPSVIICGKTTSGDSHDLFIDEIQKGKTFHEACFSTIYANKMRENLFEYLYKIGFFDYLKNIEPYWETKNYKEKWNLMFTSLDESVNAGIQLTQAFNCAILNKNSKKRSTEQKSIIFRKIQRKTRCLFKHFSISENLKLIIFLDTPSNNSMFHQIQFWTREFNLEKNDFKVISITHPSPQNMDVYNHLDDLNQITSNKKKRAIELFENAKLEIANLMEEIS